MEESRIENRESRKVNSYRELFVWQKAMTLTKDIYTATKSFPKEEMFGLQSQIRRSAVSIPSNVAEGKSRRSTQEYIRFINIASGSLAELETQLILTGDLGFLALDSKKLLLEQCDEISRMLQGLHDALLAKVQSTRLTTHDSNN